MASYQSALRLCSVVLVWILCGPDGSDVHFSDSPDVHFYLAYVHGACPRLCTSGPFPFFLKGGDGGTQATLPVPPHVHLPTTPSSESKYNTK